MGFRGVVDASESVLDTPLPGVKLNIKYLYKAFDYILNHTDKKLILTNHTSPLLLPLHGYIGHRYAELLGKRLAIISGYFSEYPVIIHNDLFFKQSDDVSKLNQLMSKFWHVMKDSIQESGLQDNSEWSSPVSNYGQLFTSLSKVMIDDVFPELKPHLKSLLFSSVTELVTMDERVNINEKPSKKRIRL